MESIQPPQEESIFAEELHEIASFEEAAKGQRFVNFLVDTIAMRWGLNYLISPAVVYILIDLAPEWIYSINTGSVAFFMLSYLVWAINYLAYYPICEKAFRGYTLGKLLSGTRAIREDGQELTMKDAFLRTISRLVPLEAFSGFGNRPWHDSWTKTTVIKSR